MRRILVILFLFSLSFSLVAQNVTVTGRANRSDALVRLMVCDDLLNMHETSVAETRSNDQGFFILEGAVERTVPAAIYVDLERVDFIVTPDASYEVEIIVPEVDPSLSYFERPQPTFRVKKANDKGRYREMVLSEMIINDYTLEYFDQIYMRRQYRYLDSLQAAIDRELHVTDPYVLQANRYKIASIQMALNADGGKKVIQEYYDGKPVLFDCQPYMDLFKDLFKTYSLTPDFANRNQELSAMINIYQLRTLYYEDHQSHRYVKGQLQSIAKQSKSSVIQHIISNTLGRFDRFAQGADAPDFELPAADGTPVQLSDYQNSIVVLQFVDESSRLVDHQFQTLDELHRQWQDSVQLITISTKDQLANHQRRFQEHRYDWPLLNLGNDILLLERYEVRTFPEYFIILPGTKIGMAPAPVPERALDKVVTKLYGK